MYKIFVNDNPFIIAPPGGVLPPYAQLKVVDESDPKKVMQFIKELESLQPRAIACITSQAEKVFNTLLGEFITIKAAGGVVFNRKGEVLLIKRLGKWDLPKGKIDPNEQAEDAAVREVQEECGISELEIKSFLSFSFHTYKQQGYRFLKQTSWYIMESTYEGKLQPQVEESITEVRWVPWNELKIDELDSYLSIKDILLQIK